MALQAPGPFERLKQEADERKRRGEPVQRCCQPFCNRGSMASSGDGWDARWCEYHRAKVARHGHPEAGTIPGPELAPYVETAERLIRQELAKGSLWVTHARTAVWGTMQSAGRAATVAEATQWGAHDKMRAVFARLREAGLPPERLMALCLGLNALITDNHWHPSSADYRITQLGKAILRRASGTHRRYEQPVAKRVVGNNNVIEYDGSTTTVVVRHYTKSSGQFLRHIGRAMEEACGDLSATMRPAIIAAKDAKYGRHPCHTAPGWEPGWKVKDRARHEAALRQRQQQQAEVHRLANLRRALLGRP